MNKNRLVLLHLSLISGVGPKVVLKIVKNFFDDFYANQPNSQIRNLDIDLQELYQCKAFDFSQKFELSLNIGQKLFEGLRDKEILEKELALIEKHEIGLFSFLDLEYPEILKEIYLPPTILYSKGAKLDVQGKRLAIVGARKSNLYAKQVIETLVPGLVENGWQIVSGGAIGADSMAHVATLNAKGKTVAVLGSGLLNMYPACNEKLFDKIVESGGVVCSPFPLQFPPEKGNFPARNRIISGLCQGCIVVQAARKSGALITASFALDQGRHVFAIPGSIHDELSLGCHEIIKQGAKPVSCVNDILEEFAPNLKVEEVKPQQKEIPKEEKVEKIVEESNEDDSLLGLLKHPCNIDELSVKSGLDLSQLQAKLFDLQLEGKVKQNFAGSWQKV